MLTKRTAVFGGRRTDKLRHQRELIICVPWSQQFDAAYQQFVNGGFPAGGLGSYGGGFPSGGFGGVPSYGGLGSYGGGFPSAGFGGASPCGGLGSYGGGFGGASPFGGFGGTSPFGGFGGASPFGGFGGASPFGGSLGGGLLPIHGVPIGFGMTTSL
ncbi:unnamed protein product [Rotaria magnacalcarata]|uniref:Uncharacterized protein n=1 Tax=Rotaria magnacalcarata TaxID=392030 RepID=A0A819HR12_9BILA|nr:unnamed protein product [Rotaria magnacalcarata]CAF3905049.1 unnamed protein product [Rotaria magnacalcarata]